MTGTMQSQHDAILHTELHRIILELFISKPIHFLPHPMHNFSSIVFMRINQPCLKSFSEMNFTKYNTYKHLWYVVWSSCQAWRKVDLQFLNCQLSNLQLSIQHTLPVQLFRQQKNKPLLIYPSRCSRDSFEPKTKIIFQFSRALF